LVGKFRTSAMTYSKASILIRDIIPFLFALLGLAIAALGIDAALHLLDAVWVGRYLGIAGTVLIIASLHYSLSKRKWVTRGHPVTLLRRHEYTAWAGSLLILVHAGIHFNAILAWLATLAMIVNVISGLTGKFLLKRARVRIEGQRASLKQSGVSDDEIADLIHWNSLTYDAVKKWRTVHVPITLAFAVSATGHIIAVFLFWGWK
jgi:hypothetical protein